MWPGSGRFQNMRNGGGPCPHGLQATCTSGRSQAGYSVEMECGPLHRELSLNLLAGNRLRLLKGRGALSPLKSPSSPPRMGVPTLRSRCLAPPLTAMCQLRYGPWHLGGTDYIATLISSKNDVGYKDAVLAMQCKTDLVGP